ncbi:hypothetical protein [Chitinophaga sp. 22620]|uniref:hypothetical protein n=1 Tax=Chitinophaga sp. 22620 TaxID=3453952 RepID=UPI003F8301A1
MKFSFHRFILLLKLQLEVNRRFYLLGAAAVAGLLLVYMIFRAANGDLGFEFDAQEESYDFTLLFSCVTFGTLAFRQFSGRSRRIQALMMPVSALERLAVAFLLVFILFPAGFTLLYLLCNALANQVDIQVFGHPNELYLLNGETGINALTILFLLLPVTLLCAVWFRKLTFVKTLVMLCVPVLVFSFFNSMLGKMVISSVQPAPYEGTRFAYWAATPFMYLSVAGDMPGGQSGFRVYNLALPPGQQWIFTLFLCLIPVVFVYLAYLKLREQEL